MRYYIIKTFRFLIFFTFKWVPRYFASFIDLSYKIITKKKVNPRFIMYHFSSEHTDFSYWLASILISFTPGTIAVNYDETHLLVHVFDEEDEEDVTEFLEDFLAVIK
ncbi:MAG: Na+/H+ antiporter subunit E [Deltaproteobacteria bacterium]|nr:Na+/H+ antiporter subunit E [Deltaproteobacteria bacterium]MCX7952094.1 Na+/H+ antiporter subunit E [Deltaproteobacteria bacterium]